MTGTYRAAVCTALNGPDSIEILEQPERPLESGEVRIAVRAAGLNFPDVMMTYGQHQHHPDPPFIPGLEAAGKIIEVSKNVSGLHIGDRVMTGSMGGMLAEQLVVSASSVTHLPKSLSFAEGACWHISASTAWHSLVEQGKLQTGESVLILGASGGVGMAAVKLAKHLGTLVIATGSTTEKRDAAKEVGADHALDPADPDLAKKVKALTNGEGVNIVYDPVGGDLAITATRCIAWAGRYLIVGFASGDIPSFPANHILIKTYQLIGIRAGESPRRDPEMATRQSNALTELAEQGVMRPMISYRAKLEDTTDALRLLEQRKIVGRAVIEMI